MKGRKGGLPRLKKDYVPPLMETINEKELLGEAICPRGEQTLYETNVAY